MQQPETLQLAAGNVSVLCRRRPGRTDPNDDCAGVIETNAGGIVLIVADGVGGGPVGHKASSIAVHALADRVRATTADGDLRPAILDGIEQANREILELGVGAATTLTVVEIHDRVARGYQVGDSTALIIGGRGAIKWKSTLHSPVGYAVESGMLDETAAMLHDDRHIVSNLVGSRTMHIEIGPIRSLAPRDAVILGSDGMFDNLRLEEIIQCARSGKPPDRVANLAALATRSMMDGGDGQPGKPDDLTVLIHTQ